MEELFVPYELALKLNEKGFNEECLRYFGLKRYTISTEYATYVGELLHEDVYKYLSFYQMDFEFLEAPLYQQAVSWLMKKLDFNYPYLSLEVCSDGSGCWHQTEDDGNDRVHFDFHNINEAIEQALTLIK